MQSEPRRTRSFGLASSAFARHYLRNLGWCLFLALLRCFSSGGSLPTPILFNAGWLSIAQPGFPIRKSPDRCVFAAPRSLSQLVTSFFGSWCQGIPLALFIAWSTSNLAHIWRFPQAKSFLCSRVFLFPIKQVLWGPRYNYLNYNGLAVSLELCKPHKSVIFSKL